MWANTLTRDEANAEQMHPAALLKLGLCMEAASPTLALLPCCPSQASGCAWQHTGEGLCQEAGVAGHVNDQRVCMAYHDLLATDEERICGER